MDDLNRAADVLVCGILNRRFLPREDLVAYAVDALRSIQATQRERDAAYLEGRAGHMDQGEPGSPARWMARIFRDEAKAIREQA